MKRIITLGLAWLIGLSALGQTGKFVTTDQNGILNSPTNFWTANASALSAAVNTSLLVPNSRLISTSGSLSGGGDLSANRTLSLVGDNASPGTWFFYGTDGSGSKGFYALPSGGIADAPNNGVAHVRRSGAWHTNDFSLITGTASDGQIPAAIARDSEVTSLLSGYQPLDADLTDLADGSLTGSKVGSGIDGANITTGTTGTGLLVRQSAAGGSSIGTNGAAVGYPAVYQPDGTIATTNSATISNLTVAGTFDIGTNIVPMARGGHGGTNAAQALANIGAQATDADLDDLADGSLTGSKVGSGIDAGNITAGTLDNLRLDADLQDLADGSLSGSKVGTGIDGDNVTANTVGTGLLVRQSAAGGSFTWDVDVTFSITNAAAEFYPVYTNVVPDGVARSFFLRMQESGATNSADFNFGGRVVNRSGSASSTNWVEHYYATEANSWAYVTNVGTNAVVYVRGPVNGPQNGRVWGTLSSVNNGGTLAGGGPPPMTNAVYAFWAMTGTGSANESDLIGTNTLVVSAGDTIPTTNNLPVTPARLFNDGEDDYMTAYQVPLVSTESFTIGGWVRADSAAATRFIFSRTNAFSLRMAATDSTLRFTVANSTTNKEVTGQVIGSGTNYFVGAAYDVTNATMTLTICSTGGTNIYTGTFAPGVETGTADTFISASTSNLGLNWAGSLDELFFAKRAFTTNECIKLFNGGLGVAWPWTGL